MIRINLLPTKPGGGGGGGGDVGAVVGLIAFLLLALSSLPAVYLYWSNYEARLQYARDKIRQEQAAINRLKEAIRLIEEYKRQKAELERQLKIIHDLKNSRRGPVRFLDEISIRIPKKVWLTGIQQRNQIIVISGFAEANEWVANFLKYLEASPFIVDVNLSSSVRSTFNHPGSQRGESVVRFNLSCRIAQST
ncbi:MAG: PilN domain-containing protein [Myxococcales bacterium]|nr:PilN domain-containing protein [Myxococcales bacterium]MCB9643428.1 PilN domain-containing protein [Myxococcales bacterium]